MSSVVLKIVLRVIAGVWAFVLVSGGTVYVNRTDPIGPVPGKQIRGQEVVDPMIDWSLAGEYSSVVVEARPSRSYSVNTSFVVHGADVYVSCAAGGESQWGGYLVEDPDMRLRVGEKIYRGRAIRVENPDLQGEILEAWMQKYPRMRQTMTPEREATIRFFRIDPARSEDA